MKNEEEKKEKYDKIEIENCLNGKPEYTNEEKNNGTLKYMSESSNQETKINITVQTTQIQLPQEYIKVIEIKDLPPEQYYGNLEYKLKLVHTSNDRIEGLTTQMKFRLQEGHGECYYMIGVEDNGNPLGLSEEELKKSLETLKTISEKLGAKFFILNEHQGKIGKFAEIMITVENFIHDKMEIKIGLIGDESSGKSSIVIIILLPRLESL